MRIKYLSKFVSVIVLLVASSVSAQIDLPFDYFYGRWVEGHYLNSSFSGTDLDLYHDVTNYSFTKNSWQIKVNNFGDHLLWDKDGDYTKSASFDIKYRVNNHWEVGITNIVLLRNESENRQLQNYESYKYEKYLSKKVTFISNYSKKNNIRISGLHLPYAYIHNKLLTKGNLIIQNSVFLNHSNSSFEFIRLQNYSPFNFPSYLTGSFKSDNRYDEMKNSIVYGVNDDNNILLEINLRLYSNDSHNTTSRYYCDSLNTQDELLLEIEKRVNSNTLLSYNIEYITGSFAPFYIETSISQAFVKASNEYDSERINLKTDSNIVSYNNATQSDLQKLSTTFGLKLNYLSSGEFDGRIIINDYNNYYRKMLFSKQVLASFKINYSEYGFSFENKNQSSAMDIVLGYGITNQLNLESIFAYRYWKNASNNRWDNIISNEIIQYNIGLKYRSYLFDASQRKWASDTQDEIRFGSLLQAKECFINLVYYPPNYSGSSETNIDLFSFTNLEKSSHARLFLQSNIGIGRNTEVSFNYDRTLRDGNDAIVQQLGIVKRLLGKMNFTLTFEQNNGSNSLHHETYVFGNIELLL